MKGKLISLIVISFSIGFISCQKENETSLQIQEKEPLLFWKETKRCQNKLPFCYRAYRYQKSDHPLSEEQQEMNIDTKGVMYIFTPISVLRHGPQPELPNNINQESFKVWFDRHVVAGFLLKENFFKADRIFQRDNVWHVWGAKLLYSKCDLNIHLKYIQHPLVFVFLWDIKTHENRNIISKIEFFSLKKFRTSLSIKGFIDEAKDI